MSAGRQNEFVQDRAETRHPPFEAVSGDHLDARANALPIVRRAFDGNRRYSANAKHHVSEVAGEAVHDGHFAGGADVQRSGGKIANQSFMQHGVRRLPDLRGKVRNRALELV
jgi:hypothetical protein